jgi:putative ABC transport system permease protein
MFRIALKTALAKKLRLFSTALSIMIAVAFLGGTLVFTDTIRRTFDDLFADVYATTDSWVRSSASVELELGAEQRGRIPDSLLATVRGVDGVAEAQPYVQGFAQIVSSDGDPIGNPGEGAPTFAMTYSEGVLNPWDLTDGSRAPGPGELVIDKGSADLGQLSIGDRVTVITQSGPHEFPLVGIARFGSADSPAGASVSLFDVATAQEVLVGGAHDLDAVVVRAVDGVNEEELTARIARVLPQGVEAVTGTEITRETQNSFRQAMSFFNTFLLVFAVIGLVVAAFTIYNTFQIIITQRTHEMALLRSIGATRRQVLGSELIEATLVGTVASAVGLAAGVVVAALLKAMMAAFGVDIPAGGTVFTARTAVVALVVGIVVTVVAAVFPSLRASRIPPLAAIRDVAVDTSNQSRRRLVSGGAITAIGVGAFVFGLSGAGIEWVGVGALATFVGVFMLGPLIARPGAKAIGAPLPALTGVVGELARENAERNPKRTSRTGGALMVGVALVAAITIIAASAKDWIRDVYAEQFSGDYVVSTATTGFGGLDPALAIAVDRLPEVAVATGVRAGAATDLADGSDTGYVAVDPATAGQLFDIGMVEGSLADLTVDGILVDEGEANKRGIVVGDQLPFRFLDGVTRRLIVQGIYTDDELAGKFVISQALHERTGVDQFDVAVYVAKNPGVSDAAAESAVASVADRYPNAEVNSRTEYIDSQAAQVDPLVNLMYGLLGLAVLISLINIANSMALSIHERTRELGLLRAVGMTRRQTRRSVRWEAVIIALLGTALGIVVGVFFGWSISVTIRDAGLGVFTLPVAPLIVITLIAVLGAVLAAIRPAWRAARLDVLRAIANE